MTQPRIYVACLAAYNNGQLHGAWLTADSGEAELHESIRNMLAASPIAHAEEWAIHDHEGFCGIAVAEYASMETVARLAEFAAEHEELGAAVLAYFGGDLDEAEEALKDRYFGVWKSLADYLEETTDEVGSLPAHLRPYIDWQAMARDVNYSGDLLTIETNWDEVHIFATA